MAVSLLSLGALINAGARLAGGLLSRFIDAKWTLLALALLLLAAGSLAPCADGQRRDAAGLCARGIGIGSGLTFFASTILLFSTISAANPIWNFFATVNVISTIGSVGPVFAGTDL